MTKKSGKGRRNAEKAGKEPDGTKLKSESNWGHRRTTKRNEDKKWREKTKERLNKAEGKEERGEKRVCGGGGEGCGKGEAEAQGEG